MNKTITKINQSSRLSYLDGFRGLAILLVVFFHTYSRWPELVPYGGAYKDFVVFKYGNFGVFLFYLISGFVILMTLERCSSFREFIRRRWLRLFPAMLVASIFILSTAAFLHERPMGQPRLVDAASGLMFVSPYYLQLIFGGNFGMLEGAFHTLYVEVIFYLIFGLSYFYKKERSIQILIGLSVFGFFVNVFLRLDVLLGMNKAVLDFINHLGLQYFCWFATGTLTYEYYKKRSKSGLIALLLSGIFSSITMISKTSYAGLVVSLFVVLIFILPMFSKRIERMFSSKILIFFGFISYPLYLFHEDAIIALIIKFGRLPLNIPMFLIPMIPILSVIIIAYLMAKYLEPITKKYLLVFFIKTIKLINAQLSRIRSLKIKESDPI